MAEEFGAQPPDERKSALARSMRLPMLSGKASAAVLLGCFASDQSAHRAVGSAFAALDRF